MKTEALRYCIQAQYGKVDYEAARKEMTDIEYEIYELTTAHNKSMQADAVNNTATIKMLMAQLAELKAPIEEIKHYVGNPSAWEHYDDGVSEKIRAILKAAGMA